MALRTILTSKPEGPYSRPPPLHICVVAMKDQPRVLSWEFHEGKAKAASLKKNAVIAISDGHSCTKVTLYEDYAQKVKEGSSYVMRGYNVRGQSPPYILNVNKDTAFFRSSVLPVAEELKQQAQALLYPGSTLTPLRACRESVGLVTVVAEVIEVSAVKKVVVGRDTVPLLNITVQQEETTLPVCLWREAAQTDITIGMQIQLSHLRGSDSAYGYRMQSTISTQIEVLTSTAVRVVGAMGVIEVEGAPGVLQLLLDDDTTLQIREDKWGPIEAKMVTPPIIVEIRVVGGFVDRIEAVEA